jgi:hypothetical protein
MHLRNDFLADEMVDIADDGSDDWWETKYGPKFNWDAAERSKIRIEARKWLMGKSQPKWRQGRDDSQGGWRRSPQCSP